MNWRNSYVSKSYETKRSRKCDHTFYRGCSSNHRSSTASYKSSAKSRYDLFYLLRSIYCKFDPAIQRQHHLSLSRYFREDQQTVKKIRSHDDIGSHCRKLHTGMSSRFKRTCRLHASRNRMEHCHHRNFNQSLLDLLSEMVLIHTVYRDGMDMCTRISNHLRETIHSCIRMAARWRNHLYDRRCNLWFEIKHL